MKIYKWGDLIWKNKVNKFVRKMNHVYPSPKKMANTYN